MHRRLGTLALFSQHFTPTESKYSAFDRELLAAYLAARKFQTFIEGRQCVLFTDHKPPQIHGLPANRDTSLPLRN